MDNQPLSWFLVLVITVLVYYFFLLLNVLIGRKKRKAGVPLPPGPPAWPIVGNLFQLERKPTAAFTALSQHYGPLMTLYLGMKTAVVVSSSAMAKEVLKTHDHIFAGRTIMETGKTLSHHKSSIVLGEYGPRWRFLRRIASTEMFIPKRLQDLQHLRRDQVFRMTRLIFEDSKVIGKSINIAHAVFSAGFNLLGNMIFSTSLYDPTNPASMEFKNDFSTPVKLAGTPNLSDFFPFLAFLDPQGLCRRSLVCNKRVHAFLNVLIENRLATRNQNSNRNKDFLDVLLDSKKDDLSIENIRALTFELLTAGSETSATTVEWAMAELIRNPEAMKRAQQELEEVVGPSRKVEESNIDHLPYLHAVVKEVFRLHPPLPLMIPHRAESDCELAGYMIPKNTQVIVNVFAIGRDPAVWKEPSKFLPQRFLEGDKSNMEYKGQHYELIPFGSGRRICPGLPLGDRMVHLILASLLHSFDWNLPDGMSYDQLDMNDVVGAALKKAVDLVAIPVPRLPYHVY